MATICCRSWTSVISWFFLEILNCARLHVDLEPAPQRLHEVEAHRRRQLRVEVGERVVRGAAGGVPADDERRARLEQLLDAGGAAEGAAGQGFLGAGAGQEAVGHLVAVAELHAAGQLRQPHAARDVDVGLGQLRVDALDLHVEVLLEGDLHGLLDGQPAGRTTALLLLDRRRLRRRRGRRALPGRGRRREHGLRRHGLGRCGLGGARAGAVRGRAPPVRIRTREPPPSRAPRARLALRHQAG